MPNDFFYLIGALMAAGGIVTLSMALSATLRWNAEKKKMLAAKPDMDLEPVFDEARSRLGRRFLARMQDRPGWYNERTIEHEEALIPPSVKAAMDRLLVPGQIRRGIISTVVIAPAVAFVLPALPDLIFQLADMP